MAEGRLHGTPWAELVARWQAVRASIAGTCMAPDAPAACRECGLRNAGIAEFVPEIAVLAREQRVRLCGSPQAVATAIPPPESEPDAGPWIVAVAYRIPEHRVRDFCAWNDAAFRAQGVQVVLVVEKPYLGLPECVRQVPYTQPMTVFSIARTKNAGLAPRLPRRPRAAWPS